MIDIIKRNILGVIVIAVVLGYFLLGASVRFINAYRFQEEWERFDSQSYFQTETFPDGLRLDYPKSWELYVYEKGKKIPEIRVVFTRPNYFLFADTELRVYWQRTDGNWTLEDARDWYVENLAFSIRDAELEQKQASFQEITVGVDNYPALTQTFETYGRGNPRKQVVLLVIGDEAFALTFRRKGNDEEALKIFERMLNSLEIYE